MGKLKNAKIMLEEAIIDEIDAATIDAWDELLDIIEDKKDELREDIWNRIAILIEDHPEFGLFDMDDVDEIMEDAHGTDLNNTVDDYIYSNWDV